MTEARVFAGFGRWMHVVTIWLLAVILLGVCPVLAEEAGQDGELLIRLFLMIEKLSCSMPGTDFFKII